MKDFFGYLELMEKSLCDKLFFLQKIDLNDYDCVLDFGLSPIMGKFSRVQFQSSLRLEKYLRNQEWKIKFDIDIKY